MVSLIEMIKNKLLHSELARFCVVGAVGFVADFGVLLSLTSAGMDPYFGRVVSVLVAITITYFLNKNFTFSKKIGRSPSCFSELTRWLRYINACMLGAIANFLAYSLTVFVLNESKVSLAIGFFLGSLIGLAINFSMSKRVFCSQG